MQRQYATQRYTIGADSDDVRVETLRGREKVVAPVRLVREMVLKGEFLPFEEIEATQLAWNAKPVTVTHPRTEDGDFIPASAPEQFESHVSGMQFGVEARSANRSLDGMVWIDREHSADVAETLGRDDPAELLLDGETVENSVGYWYERFQADGEFEGEEFDAVQVNVQPDHLALLPNGEGECSVDDGCGVNRDDSGVSLSALRSPSPMSYAGADCLELEATDGEQHFAGACSDCGGSCDLTTNGSGHDTPGQTMTDDRINDLVERSAFDADDLDDMTDEQLDALEDSLEEQSNDDGGDDDVGAGFPDEQLNEITDQLTSHVDEKFEQLKREQEAEQREQLIGEICAHTGDEPDDYEDWATEQLETFASNLGSAGGIYAGQAGSRQDGDGFGDIQIGGAFRSFDQTEEGE